MSATTILFKLKSMAILLAGIFLLVACDKIDEPFTKKAASGGNDTTGGVTKRVLLEDYTGHTCVNCPKAAKIAQGLKTTYGDRLVVLAIHAGGFANPTSGGDFTYDFRTDAGTAWDSFFGISNVGNPNGLVNRKGYPGNHILSPSAWGGAISTALAGEPELDLAISNQYNASTRQLSTEITTTFLSPLDISLHLVVVLTESGIVKPQRNNDATIGIVPVIPDYVHNHVLRGLSLQPGVPRLHTPVPLTLRRSLNPSLMHLTVDLCPKTVKSLHLFITVTQKRYCRRLKRI